MCVRASEVFTVAVSGPTLLFSESLAIKHMLVWRFGLMRHFIVFDFYKWRFVSLRRASKKEIEIGLIKLLSRLFIYFVSARARARAHTHTHTHTHIYIYICVLLTSVLKRWPQT